MNRKEQRKEYRLKNKERIKKQRKEYYLKNIEQVKEYQLKNKEHIKEYRKEYYLKNIEHIKEYYLKTKEHQKEYSREYYSKNKEERSKQFKKYYSENVEKRKEYIKEYNSRPETQELRRNRVNNRYNTDINFRISTLCRNRVRLALKGLNKSASTMKLIGCTPDELREHIESLFEPWMTWENQGRGGWDIEHIKACATFNLVDPEEQCACFNWSNLQPMEHIANIKKGVG
jgi:hypothetical protein